MQKLDEIFSLVYTTVTAWEETYTEIPVGARVLFFLGVLHLFYVISFLFVLIRIGNRRAIIESNEGWQDTRRTHGGVGMFFSLQIKSRKCCCDGQIFCLSALAVYLFS